MTQLGLDLTPPRTHARDPGSSHRAEARIRKSGHLNRQQRIVYTSVVLRPGSTASQISARVLLICGGIFATNNHERLCQVRRRLSDLATDKLDRVRRQYTPGESESRWFPAGE